MALTIDLAASARRLSDTEFRVWAQGQTIFLSSVMGEFADEREAVGNTLEQLDFTVRRFEDLGGRDDAAGPAYLSEVRSSTLYLGLLGDQHGSMLAEEPYSGFSATHAEYLEARASGKRVSFWERKPAEQREGHARKFLTEVQLFHVTGSFAGAPDLPAARPKTFAATRHEYCSNHVTLAPKVSGSALAPSPGQLSFAPSFEEPDHERSAYSLSVGAGACGDVCCARAGGAPPPRARTHPH